MLQATMADHVATQHSMTEESAKNASDIHVAGNAETPDYHNIQDGHTKPSLPTPTSSGHKGTPTFSWPAALPDANGEELPQEGSLAASLKGKQRDEPVGTKHEESPSHVANPALPKIRVKLPPLATGNIVTSAPLKRPDTLLGSAPTATPTLSSGNGSSNSQREDSSGTEDSSRSTSPADVSELEKAMSALKIRIAEAVSNQDWSTLVRALKECYQFKVDSHVLQATQLGADINKLRHNVPTAELKTLCLRVVRKWKTDIGIGNSPPAATRSVSEDRVSSSKANQAENGTANGNGRRASTGRLRGRRVSAIDTANLKHAPSFPATASATLTGHTRVDRNDSGSMSRKRRASTSVGSSPANSPTTPGSAEFRHRKVSRSSTMMISASQPPQLTRRMSHGVAQSPRVHHHRGPLSAGPAPLQDPEIRTLQSDHLKPPAELEGNPQRIGGLQVLYKALASHTAEDSIKVFGIATEIERLVSEQAWTGGSPVKAKNDPKTENTSNDDQNGVLKTEGKEHSDGNRIDSATVISPSSSLSSSFDDWGETPKAKPEPPTWNLATYRARTLMYAANLSNVHNVTLKSSVLCGTLAPSKLVTMTKGELEPENIQEERRRCEEQQDREIRRMTEIQVTPVRKWDYELKVSR